MGFPTTGPDMGKFIARMFPDYCSKEFTDNGMAISAPDMGVRSLRRKHMLMLLRKIGINTYSPDTPAKKLIQVLNMAFENGDFDKLIGDTLAGEKLEVDDLKKRVAELERMMIEATGGKIASEMPDPSPAGEILPALPDRSPADAVKSMSWPDIKKFAKSIGVNSNGKQRDVLEAEIIDKIETESREAA